MKIHTSSQLPPALPVRQGERGHVPGRNQVSAAPRTVTPAPVAASESARQYQRPVRIGPGSDAESVFAYESIANRAGSPRTSTIDEYI